MITFHTVHGVLKARIRKWFAIHFSSGPHSVRDISPPNNEFHLFILFMGFSRQEYGSGLPFPSPVDHILSDLSSMTLPSWVAPHSMA